MNGWINNAIIDCIFCLDLFWTSFRFCSRKCPHLITKSPASSIAGFARSALLWKNCSRKAKSSQSVDFSVFLSERRIRAHYAMGKNNGSHAPAHTSHSNIGLLLLHSFALFQRVAVAREEIMRAHTVLFRHFPGLFQGFAKQWQSVKVKMPSKWYLEIYHWEDCGCLPISSNNLLPFA